MNAIEFMGPMSGLDPVLSLRLSRALAIHDTAEIVAIVEEAARRAEEAEDKIEEAKNDASYAEDRAREAQSERDDLESEKQALETKCEAWEGIVERAYDALDKALESGCRPTKTELREVLAILKEGPKEDRKIFPKNLDTNYLTRTKLIEGGK